jgi:hypothetical protein
LLKKASFGRDHSVVIQAEGVQKQSDEVSSLSESKLTGQWRKSCDQEIYKN